MGPVVGKNWPRFAEYFPKLGMYQIFLGFEWYKPWRYMKKHQTKSKTIFGSRNSLFGPFMRYQFYIGKSPISAIPSRTQTRISWARNGILTFRKKTVTSYWKALSYELNLFFLPRTPPITLIRGLKTYILVQKSKN